MQKKIKSLHNKKVSRCDIKALIKEAKENNETEIIYRLTKILRTYPNEQYFIIEIDKINSPQGMNCPLHNGNYTEALTERGTLKRGWEFANGVIRKSKSRIAKKKVTRKPTEPKNSPKATKKQGLSCPINSKSLAYKIKKRENKKTEFYKIHNKDISSFLGNIERKNKESIVIAITGEAGSMKTRFAFQLIEAFADNYKVGHASMEEHPDSVLYWNKVNQYISNKNLANIENEEVLTIEDLNEKINSNDVIVIDSFAKIKEIDRQFEIDKDLRKKYDGKIFIVVFQETTNGKMRGGAKSGFDGDIILFVEKFQDYKQNFVWASKNRYQTTNLNDLKFNIHNQTLDYGN